MRELWANRGSNHWWRKVLSWIKITAAGNRHPPRGGEPAEKTKNESRLLPWKAKNRTEAERAWPGKTNRTEHSPSDLPSAKDHASCRQRNEQQRHRPGAEMKNRIFATTKIRSGAHRLWAREDSLQRRRKSEKRTESGDAWSWTKWGPAQETITEQVIRRQLSEPTRRKITANREWTYQPNQKLRFASTTSKTHFQICRTDNIARTAQKCNTNDFSIEIK
jgi:hypothetical protein